MAILIGTQEAGRVGHLGMRQQVLWRTSNDEFSTGVTAFWPQVNDVVSLADHLQVVFHHHDGIPLVHQRLQDMQELLDVRQVQTGGRFVKEVERAQSTCIRSYTGNSVVQQGMEGRSLTGVPMESPRHMLDGSGC